ncbi:chitin deacetylase [Paenibacillus mucilaginosus]|uniref:polysaccharide deacetylase family protein n=1 Tax=Paenibacillus mucilaginosus TaxID=61624 RepID=UPI003D21A98E
MKRKLYYTGIGILFLSLLLFGSYKLMTSRTYQLFGGLTSSVQTDRKVVALTFDDGPTKNIDSILPILDRYRAKATFFLIGQEIEAHPEAARRIAEGGHQIGNHTYSHHRMIFKTPSFIREEIEKTDMLIREAGYTGEIDVRPPNGKKLIGLPYYLKQHDRETIMWSIEPDTYSTFASEKVNFVKDNVKPGSIILMHPMYDKTGSELAAVEAILRALSDEGYTFVTVNELQALDGHSAS